LQKAIGLDDHRSLGAGDVHHHEEIDVAIRPRLSSRPGTEEDDPFGREPFHEPIDHSPDALVEMPHGCPMLVA
jgi:hypothetical protein